MMDRRKFVIKLVRASILASLTSITAYLIYRDRKEGPESCKFDFMCKSCKQITACELPQAKEYRTSRNLDYKK